MLISQLYTATVQGAPAALRVIRNDGYCWGEIRLADGWRAAIVPRRDQYDNSDDDAAAVMFRAARAGRMEPSAIVDDSFLFEE